MASSRKTGTNEQVTTYDSAGGGEDYTSLSTWEAATDTDHVTDTESDVLECTAGTHSDRTVLNGSTNNASYFRIIRPASGQGHSGIPLTDGSVVYFTTTDNFSITENWSQLQDLVSKFTLNTGGNAGGHILNADECALVGILSIDGANTGAGVIRILYGTAASPYDVYIINCLAHNNEEAGIALVACTCYVYNCTSEGNKFGLFEITGTGVAKNNIATNNSTTNILGTWTETTNTTGSPTFVDSGNDDFHLDSSDTVAKGNGTDLSADGNYAFDDDIDFETMSDWPIGFDEPVAVSGRIMGPMAGQGGLAGVGGIAGQRGGLAA